MMMKGKDLVPCSCAPRRHEVILVRCLFKFTCLPPG